MRIKANPGFPRIRSRASSCRFPARSRRRSLAAVYQDGSRYSGELEQVEKQVLKLRVPGIQEPLSLPLEGLRSLVVASPAEGSLEPPAEQPGTLELDSVRLPGRLVDGREQPGSSCLVVAAAGEHHGQPATSLGFGTDRLPRADARLDGTPSGAAAQGQPQPQGAGGFVAGFLSALSGPGNSPAQEPGKRRSLISAPVTSFLATSPHRRERRLLSHLAVVEHIRAPRQGQGR